MSEEALIKAEPLRPGNTLPLVIQPSAGRVNLVAWATGNQGFIETNLLKYGGILFRNFHVNTVAEFEQFVLVTSGALLEYRERSSPRRRVSGNIYTSTDYPANQSIFLHNENSYQQTFPLKIFFFCDTPAQRGGETPIADCRKVLQGIDPRIRERFIQKKWMYVRNFGDGFGLPWQTVFQTNDKAMVEEYCCRNNIEVEWRHDNRLRIRAILPAVARHPKTGKMVWFNHATFFHVSTLEPMIRDELLEEFEEEDLPTNTYYGDGSPIEPSVLDGLRKIYRHETISFPWQKGDLLMLDNMLVAHGRAPFIGPRKILVGMAESVSREDI